MARPLAHLLILAMVGCAGAAEPPADLVEAGRRFVESRDVRRAALEQAIVNPDNEYSATRLAMYATPGGWDELPEWRRGGEDWSVEWTHEGLMEAGEHAFTRYPMRVDGRLEPLRDGDVAGIRAESVVEVDGALAWTCATCHAAGGEHGRPNAQIDMAELYRVRDRDPGVIGSWPVGTIDPSPDGTNNPSVIGDLRAIRFQTHLHWTATLRNSLEALAVRVETLLIMSHDQQRRPPRDLAFALAYYIWHLDDGAPDADRSDLFETNCASCHDASGAVGAPLPWTGAHPGRGTGTHRVPSLYGVPDRGRLLHDGSVGSVAQLLTAGPDWHPWGRRLSVSERAALVEYVEHHFQARSD